MFLFIQTYWDGRCSINSKRSDRKFLFRPNNIHQTQLLHYSTASFDMARHNQFATSDTTATCRQSCFTHRQVLEGQRHDHRAQIFSCRNNAGRQLNTYKNMCAAKQNVDKSDYLTTIISLRCV